MKNINKLVGFAEALFTKNSNAIIAEKSNECQVKKTTQKRCSTLALDRFNKLVGFAEALFRGKNSIIVRENTKYGVSNKTNRRCFFLALNRFNNGNYYSNLTTHSRH
jgi:hypothetical protein